MDCHGAGKGWTFNSLVAEDLDPDCEFVVQDEWTEYTEFLEQGCDAALFVGMHARAGTADGVMNHTISGRDFQNLWFNGTLVGETGINAASLRDVGLSRPARHRRRRLVPRGQRAARRRPHDGRGEARLQLVQRAEPHAGSGPRADRGRREASACPISPRSRRTTRAARARSRPSTRTRTRRTAFASGPASNASTSARSSPAPTRGGRPGSSSTSVDAGSAVPIAARSYEAFAPATWTRPTCIPTSSGTRLRGSPTAALSRDRRGSSRGLRSSRSGLVGRVRRDAGAVPRRRRRCRGAGRYRGVARGTAKSLDVPFVHVWTFEDGLVRFRQFLDTAAGSRRCRHKARAYRLLT